MIQARLVAALLFVGAMPAVASEATLAISPAQLDLLGVEFAEPGPAGASALVDARAQVVVPPDALFVMSSSQPGLVLRLHVVSGQSVSRGQPLAEVQSAEFLTLQQEFLEASQDASVAAAQLDRDLKLHAEGIIAARRLDETRARALAASARRSEHEQMLRIAGLDPGQTAALSETGRLLETLTIRSPIDGVVLETYKAPGESVGPSEALARVADLSTLWLQIYVPQEEARGIAEGMRVIVGDPAGGGEGEVLATGLSVDAVTQTVTVRATLDRHSGLRPGQVVSVQLRPDDEPEAGGYSLPVAAVVNSRGRHWVFVRTSDGVEVLEVTVIGGSDGVVFLGPPEPGDRVAVSGVSALKSLWLATLGDGSQ